MRPMQPISKDEDGALRFEANSIVRRLLDHSSSLGLGLNQLAQEEHSQEDWEQFAQLIGYSLSGFSDLNYVSDHVFESASAVAHAGLDERDARIAQLQETLDEVRKGLRGAVARLYGIHPANLPV